MDFSDSYSCKVVENRPTVLKKQILYIFELHSRVLRKLLFVGPEAI